MAGDSGRATVRVALQPDEHGRRIMKERDLPDAERSLVTVDGRGLSLALHSSTFYPHLRCSNLLTTTNESEYM